MKPPATKRSVSAVECGEVGIFSDSRDRSEVHVAESPKIEILGDAEERLFWPRDSIKVYVFNELMATLKKHSFRLDTKITKSCDFNRLRSTLKTLILGG